MTLQLGRRNIPLGRSGTLAISRAVDQGILGLTSVLLAWRLGVHGFVPVSALLVVNSLCVVVSDFGLGTEILRQKVGEKAPGAVHRVRMLNVAVACASVGLGYLFPSPTRVVLIAAGVIWLASAEAFIRKSALLRIGRVSRAAAGEMTGSAVLASGLAAALLVPEHALWIIAVALFAKHAVEAAVDRGWDAALSTTGSSGWDLWLWTYQVLNFATANVDFLLVAVLVSPDAFAIYSLGYRISAVFVSQFSYVVNHVALVDFGDAHRDRALERPYRARRRQLFGFGILAAAVVAAIAPGFLLLGSQWHDVVGVVLVLACAIPWRMCAGLGLNVLVAADGAGRATRWEAARFLGSTAVLTVGGMFGLATFTAATALVAIGTTVSYDYAAAKTSGISPWSWVTIASPGAFAVASVLAWVML